MVRVVQVIILLFLITVVNFVTCGIFGGNHYGILDKHDLPFELRGYVRGPFCKNKQQSPIDIKESDIGEFKRGSEDLKFGHGYNTTIRFYIENPGHTVQVQFRKSKSKELTLSGTNIHSEHYMFAQFHYHWGKDKGSEHLINGQQFTGELHLVHFRDNYTSIVDALNKGRGDRFALLVIGVLIEEDAPTPHPGFAKLSKSLCRINKTKAHLLKTDPLHGKLMLRTLLPSGQREPVFEYDGSLTTSPCSENVRWIVFKNPIKYSKEQMDLLRNLYNDKNHHLAGADENNARPHQPLNARDVYKYTIDMRFI